MLYIELLINRESACQTGDFRDMGLIPGEGNGNPLQYSCQLNPRERGACQATCPWGHKRVRHDLGTEPPPCDINKYDHFNVSSI